jgi:hypothetical protein
MKLYTGFAIILIVVMGMRSMRSYAEDDVKAAAVPAVPVVPAEPAKVTPSEAPNSAAAPVVETPPATAPKTEEAPKTATPATSADDGEYEIDYEEEPGTDGDEVEEAPVKPKKGKKTVYAPGGGGGGIQGSRAKHRFTPILKSETKSIYKKDGKALDVDSD